MKGISKILILGIVLLILAGLIVVILGNGFNVNLNFKKHKTITLEVDEEIILTDIKNICKEVFGNKTVNIRRIDLFNDIVDINIDTIVTDEEKENLATKINEKYKTEFTTDTLIIKDTYNIRIRDLVIPYIGPVLISTAVIVVYLLIRFRKQKVLNLLASTFFLVILTQVAVLSIMAITRFPLSATVINLMFVLAIAELIIYTEHKAKEFEKVEQL